jgi:chromosome segregation ATPase
MRAALILALAPCVTANDTNPMDQVYKLMDECRDKVQKDMDAEAKAYKEYFEWCDDAAKNSQFEIKTAASEKEELEAKIAEFTSNIGGSNTKIEELAASIATDEKELAEAQAVRDKERAEFESSEKELVEDVDTLDRAIAILERELSKNPGAFAQITNGNANAIVQALGAITDAASFTTMDKSRLTAMIQQQQGDTDDDMELGAPAAKAYTGKAGAIVDVLEDMKEKAESQLADLRKAEGNAKHNFNMLKQSLTDSITADNTDLSQTKTALAEAEEGKATAEGDLSVTSKDLATAQDELATASTECMSVAADHEATVKSRNEELAVIAKAKQILQEAVSGASSFFQSSISSRTDLRNSEIVVLLKNLAKKQHSVALSQLASRVEAVAKYGSAAGEDPFVKIKGLITDMIGKLEKEAEDDANEKAFCDEEMAKTEAKKQDLEATVEALTSKIDSAAATSAKRKSQVKDLQSRLASLVKEQAQMDSIRAEENSDYTVAKEDLEQALNGVQKALGVLRDYYGGAASAALMQEEQPAKPAKHEKSTGAGQSIINILEVCESDFSENLAKEETEEANSAAAYDKTSQENKIAKVQMEQDVKYKTQEFKSLDKQIGELGSDKSTAANELGAVMEYYSGIKVRCVAKPESYADRKARRESEIAGLKEALDILENETAFMQRKRRGLRGGALKA